MWVLMIEEKNLLSEYSTVCLIAREQKRVFT